MDLNPVFYSGFPEKVPIFSLSKANRRNKMLYIFFLLQIILYFVILGNLIHSNFKCFGTFTNVLQLNFAENTSVFTVLQKRKDFFVTLLLH